MALFIIGTVLFSILALVFTLALALWTYEDAKVKSDQSPVLWLLVVLLTNPVGIIIYLLAGRKKGVPAPRKYKKFLIVSLVAFLLSSGLFTAGLVGFVGDFGGTGLASSRSGNFTMFRSSLSDNVWSFTARSANGWERRSPNLSAEQLRNIHVLSDSGDGIRIRFEQDGTVEIFDISNFFDEQIDMSAFEPGRVRVTLQFDNARDVDVRVSWRG